MNVVGVQTVLYLAAITWAGLYPDVSWADVSSQSVMALVKQLEDGDESVRIRMVQQLGAMGPEAKAAVRPLIARAVEDQDKEVRRQAAEALGQIDAPEATSGLIRFLEGEDKKVRRRAATALGYVGDAAAVPTLIRALEDQDWALPTYAIGALGEIGKPAVPALIEALETGDTQLIPYFAELSRKYGDQGLEIIWVVFESEAEQAVGLVESVVKRNQIEYPVLRGDEKIYKAYELEQAVPVTFLIDRKGITQRVYVGYQPKAEFDAGIQLILK